MKLCALPIDFSRRDYREVPDEVLVYMDPPYSGTYDYQGRSFDHAVFWDFVKKRTGPTFVSELNGPEDLEIVWRQQHNSQMVSNAAATAGRIKQREERLYFWPGSNVRPTDPPASK